MSKADDVVFTVKAGEAITIIVKIDIQAYIAEKGPSAELKHVLIQSSELKNCVFDLMRRRGYNVDQIKVV